MSQNYENFVAAIHNKKLVSVDVITEEKGHIERKCVPYDFAVSTKYKDGLERYHFNDLTSPDGPHNLAVLPENLVKLTVLEEGFNPGDYIKWQPHWTIPRDWGQFS